MTTKNTTNIDAHTIDFQFEDRDLIMTNEMDNALSIATDPFVTKLQEYHHCPLNVYIEKNCQCISPDAAQQAIQQREMEKTNNFTLQGKRQDSSNGLDSIPPHTLLPNKILQGIRIQLLEDLVNAFQPQPINYAFTFNDLRT